MAVVASLVAATSTQAQLPAASAPAAPAATHSLAGTPVRLMVMNEVTTRSTKVGDRFKLRVDENVMFGGATLIPVGAIAWGEVTSLDQSGAAGKRGSLSARLLYVDLPTGPLALRGSQSDTGDANTAGTVLAVVGFGLLGLLNRGNNAKLKAGDIFTGYLEGELGSSASSGQP